MPDADFSSVSPAPYMSREVLAVDCMTPAVVPLVIDTIESALGQHKTG